MDAKPEPSKPIHIPNVSKSKPLSSEASSNPFDSLKFTADTRALLAPAPREIEIRYLLPPHLLSSIVGSNQPKGITQHYFPHSDLKSLLKRFSVHALVAGADTFTSARVRKTQNPRGEISYDIEFKGPKEKLYGLRISRAEFGLSISRSEFKELRAKATAGMVRKLRYEVEGSIQDERNTVPTVAQIDVFKMAGTPPRRLKQEYITVDVELNEERLLAPFWHGHHSFSFLSDCVDMVSNGKKIRRNLSSTEVAHHGLGKKQLAALDKATAILIQRNLAKAE